MNRTWVYFLAAMLFGSYILVSRGAPILPVVAGCAAVAGINLWRVRSHASVNAHNGSPRPRLFWRAAEIAWRSVRS